MSNITINESSFEDVNYQQKIFDLLSESVKINQSDFIPLPLESKSSSPITINESSFEDINYQQKIFDLLSESYLLKPKENFINYSFERKQLGFFEYYKDNGQRVKKPYYSQMFKSEPDVDGNYSFVSIPNIEKLLEKKVFQDVIEEVNPKYSVVEVAGNHMRINTYTSQLYYSIGDGVSFESYYEITTLYLDNLSSSETTLYINNIGIILIYLQFTLSDDQEIILEENLTI
ncbi:hypothetical protein C3729_10440 [Cloacibacterium normanense]|uniref:Uncharacterized protein n=1 Tax=Cloacibacterium normanense TaxID=237258 RepID=A0A2S7I3C2_9FLAO|nr:hypothetical protein [Cloacibacterium normanense]PPZ91082.1 hypothetical protein C3729_10440 [Cloacibacterium normanense]